MKISMWHVELGGDSLELLATEVEELENDELSLGEAGFIQGYEDYDELLFEEDTD